MRERGLAVYRGLWALCIALSLALTAIAAAATNSSETAAPKAVLLAIEGPIGPATESYVKDGLEHAAETGAEVVVLRLDTPGGLDAAMRVIIEDILASPVPVACLVAPSGARAASAGTYILYACHVSAMAPATTLGAATPVQIGAPGLPTPRKPPDLVPTEPEETPEEKKSKGETADTKEGETGKPAVRRPGTAMERKVINDAAAYIRGLAELRGRNAEWAELAVREAASLTATEAKAQNVVDLVVADVPALLAAIDGRTVEVGGEARTLKTAGLVVEAVEPSWQQQFLAIIANPNVALILMMLGVYGMIFELSNPGAILPGVVGGICLVLGLYALHVLPVNWAGLALIALGVGLMVAEAFAPSFGILGLGGVVAFVIGATLLFDTDAPGFKLSMWVIGSTAAISVAFLCLLLAYVVRSHRRPVTTGAEEMIGMVGTVRDWSGTNGMIHVHGELWKASGPAGLAAGQAVRVEALDGLILAVIPTDLTPTDGSPADPLRNAGIPASSQRGAS